MAHCYYCDGSCIGNPGPGGWGWIHLIDEKEVSHGSARSTMTTNNQMELSAIIDALEDFNMFPKGERAEFKSDSSYVILGINEWSDKWIKKGFAKVKNPELWKRLLALVDKSRMTFTWVKGHAGEEHNERVDKLAKGLL